jgi:trans-2,3-dihydro-3-hydroxyanthranilate isomerase
MTALPFATCDVFTDTPYTGNPLAIVEGADALTTEQMQSIAREFNLSETIFVQTPDDPDNTAKVRIFFPTAEIPFAGHPTIGCAIHLAKQRNAGADWDDLITLEEVAGLVPVTVACRGGQIRAEFTAPQLPVPLGGDTSPALIGKALGLSAGQIGYGTHVPRVWKAGPDFLFVPLAGPHALAAAKPSGAAWAELSRNTNESVFLYTPAGDQTFRTRMFAPDHGVPEDPATGSASAIFAAQLLAGGDLDPEGTTAFTLVQGVEMGRPSDIGLSVDCAGGKITAIRIAGGAVPVMSGQITPPAA